MFPRFVAVAFGLATAQECQSGSACDDVDGVALLQGALNIHRVNHDRSSKQMPEYRSELLSKEEGEALGVVHRGNSSTSHDELPMVEEYPADYNWCNRTDLGGQSFCSISRNQHIPQYCGSCWAHAAVSALADRVKIARKGRGVDINPSVQHILNCGNVGTCRGGTMDGPYQWMYEISKNGSGITLETAAPYLACSRNSPDGFCPYVDTSCQPINVARTCTGLVHSHGPCHAIEPYPNIKISGYGSISGSEAMQKEIFHRGPITCAVDAGWLVDYRHGVLTSDGLTLPWGDLSHVISVTGWGTHPEHGFYWWVRNSWGEYWGEMGFARVARGAIHLGEHCNWATVESYSAAELHNQPAHCYESGSNCVPGR